MIRYCLAAGLLMSCAGIGTREEVVLLPEIEVRATPLHVKAKPLLRPLTRAVPCDPETHDDKQQEFLNKLDCVIRHEGT